MDTGGVYDHGQQRDGGIPDIDRGRSNSSGIGGRLNIVDGGLNSGLDSANVGDVHRDWVGVDAGLIR